MEEDFSKNVDFDMVPDKLEEPVPIEYYVENHLSKQKPEDFKYNYYEERNMLHDVFVMIELERVRVGCSKCIVKMYDTTLKKGVPENVLYYQAEVKIAELYAVADVLKRFNKPCNITIYSPQEYMLGRFILHKDQDEKALANYGPSVEAAVKTIRKGLSHHNYAFESLNRVY